MRWIYTDCRDGKRKHLFEAEADDIMMADRLLEQSLGIRASKESLITVHSPDWTLERKARR